MVVRILDTYELRPMDSLNWQLWMLSKGKDGNYKWKSTGRYYQNFASALKDVYERELRFLEGTYDLPQAIKRAQAVERQILEAVKDVKVIRQ
ncbi:hypothetical protein [Adlercreutzia sp. ZJ141]|uniref:hypothetical protein n=1 Tax=Adlercreutzia sp. ZJ141 TaxID=2709406 RepID=UPI0013E9A213|nr:hypothetical protein [Adlercreutzia sp. ZJ141]